MKIKRLVRLGAATLLSLSSLLTLSIPMASAAVQTCTWVGGTDTNLATAANWTNCGGGAPLAGDIISFGTGSGTTQTNLVNNLGVSLGGVISNPIPTGTAGFHIDTIALTAGAALSVASTASCTDSPVGINYGAISAAGDLTINTDAHYIAGITSLTVAGNLTIQSSNGFGGLTSATGSTVAGNVIVTSPLSYRTTTCSAVQHGGVGYQASGASVSGFTIHGLTVQKGASVFLADATYPIVLGGGTGTTNPYLSFFGNLDSNYNYVATTYTVSGAITLTSNATIYASDLVTLNVTGAISGAGFALAADPTSTGNITFNPSSNTSNTTTGSQANPATTVTVASGDNQPSVGVSTIPNETLILDGIRGSISLLSGSTLMGDGVADYLYAPIGSIVAPGHSPGCLTLGGLALFGTYQVQIGGTVACTGYDQLKVASTATTLQITNATLDVSLYNGFVPQVGQSYTIISNASTTPVTGTFNGIAEGGTYTNQGVTYSVTYVGGAGHDVVLTVTAIDASKLPAKPNTGLKLITAHPLVALATTAAAALALAYAARRMKPAHR